MSIAEAYCIRWFVISANIAVLPMISDLCFGGESISKHERTVKLAQLSGALVTIILWEQACSLG